MEDARLLQQQQMVAQMAAFAYVQGGGNKDPPPPHVDSRRCYKCGDPGHLASKCPRGGPFIPAHESPWYQKPKEEPKPPQSSQPVIRFGVRGDTMMQTRYEGPSKFVKKFRNFKADFENEFYAAFGECEVDYEVAGMWTKDVTEAVDASPFFDLLCVGVTCNELFAPFDQQPRGHNAKSLIVMEYPDELDGRLQDLAAAILKKASGSLVLCGGPAELWDYPARWDTFVERASNTLRRAGVQVVPRETANAIMVQMTLADDGVHFANVDHFKQLFAKAWAQWLLVAANDPTFGRVVTDESVRQALSENVTDSVQAALIAQMRLHSTQQAPHAREADHRERSRSPPRASGSSSSGAGPATLNPMMQALAALNPMAGGGFS